MAKLAERRTFSHAEMAGGVDLVLGQQERARDNALKCIGQRFAYPLLVRYWSITKKGYLQMLAGIRSWI